MRKIGEPRLAEEYSKIRPQLMKFIEEFCEILRIIVSNVKEILEFKLEEPMVKLLHIVKFLSET